MTIPSSALPQPITVKHVFKLCDHHQLAQLHNAIYSRIPYDKEMTIADAIDHNREYQHALALMQALASAPDITTGLILDMDIISETKNYYQEVFDITLTDAQAASIFNPTAQAGSGF